MNSPTPSAPKCPCCKRPPAGEAAGLLAAVEECERECIAVVRDIPDALYAGVHHYLVAKAFAKLRSALPPATQGMVPMPVEMTQDMITAAVDHWPHGGNIVPAIRRLYAAIIYARPEVK